jgi:hypothetical protein
MSNQLVAASALALAPAQDPVSVPKQGVFMPALNVQNLPA